MLQWAKIQNFLDLNGALVAQLDSKRSSYKVQPNCAISFWFRQYLILHTCTANLMWREIFFLHSACLVQNLWQFLLKLISSKSREDYIHLVLVYANLSWSDDEELFAGSEILMMVLIMIVLLSVTLLIYMGPM